MRLIAAACLLIGIAVSSQQNPPHLAEFPAIDRVKREIVGADAGDTLRRQMAALYQLRTILYDLALAQGRDRNEVTPDEKKMADAYYVEAATIGMNNKITTTKYDVDPRFRDGLFDQFFTPAFRANYFRLTKQMDDRIASRAANEQAQFKQAQAQANAYGAGTADPGTLEARRCIASGRNPLDCIGNAMSTGLGELFGAVNPELKPVVLPPGLRMNGVYPGPAGFSLTFRGDSVELKCGPLVPAFTPYSVDRQGARIAISLATQPAPVAFTMTPAGSIAGPASATIRGQVQVGVQEGTRTYADGRTEPISRPIFDTRDVNCSIGTLTTTGPSPRTSLGSLVDIPLFAKPAMELANSKPLLATPGLRMTGTYASPGGLGLEFHNESVVLTCRQAFVARTYRVDRTGPDISVRIDHGGAPLVLALRADGALAAPGPIAISGREVAGVRDSGEVLYVPRNDTCAAGTLTPRR